MAKFFKELTAPQQDELQRQVICFSTTPPTCHKLPYAKVGRSDAPAAMLGAGLGALVGYVALAAVGTSAFPLADLTRLLWYVGLGLFFLFTSLT